MDFNWELIDKIYDWVMKNQKPYEYPPEMEIEGYTRNEISYQIKLLHVARFILIDEDRENPDSPAHRIKLICPKFMAYYQHRKKHPGVTPSIKGGRIFFDDDKNLKDGPRKTYSKCTFYIAKRKKDD